VSAETVSGRVHYLPHHLPYPLTLPHPSTLIPNPTFIPLPFLSTCLSVFVHIIATASVLPFRLASYVPYVPSPCHINSTCCTSLDYTVYIIASIVPFSLFCMLFLFFYLFLFSLLLLLLLCRCPLRLSTLSFSIHIYIYIYATYIYLFVQLSHSNRAGKRTCVSSRIITAPRMCARASTWWSSKYGHTKIEWITCLSELWLYDTKLKSH